MQSSWVTNPHGSPWSRYRSTYCERVERIARAGRLRMPVERSVALIHAAGVGTVTTLLALPEDERDPQLSPATRDAALASIVTSLPKQDHADLASLAVGLRAHLDSLA